MKIARVHFYVEDATVWRDWFVRLLGFQPVTGSTCDRTRTEIIKSGSICFALSSPLRSDSPVAEFLRLHPPGVADLAFFVQEIEAVTAQAVSQGAKVLQPIQQQRWGNGYLKWGKISAWGSLSHTLIEVMGQGRISDFRWQIADLTQSEICHLPSDINAPCPTFTDIDHVVLNVEAGYLERAVTWYEDILGFQRQQTFKIKTDQSGLHSRVMLHPSNSVQLPINEPASANSQIQEFLDINRGPGIQHIALRTANLIQAIARLRAAGLSFIEVPPTYYTELQQRQGLPLTPNQLQAIADQQILVDWQNEIPDAKGKTPPLLLQTFTQPIFQQPTFFFELIERRVGNVNGQLQAAQGFGEGNFRALFEAIEREQIKRGSLGHRV